MKAKHTLAEIARHRGATSLEVTCGCGPKWRSILGLGGRTEQIADRLPISHETVYRHPHVDKVNVGKVHKGLRSQNPRRKRHRGGCDMETVTAEELFMVENGLNHPTRKRLGFKTPNEVFHASFKSVALRA